MNIPVIIMPREYTETQCRQCCGGHRALRPRDTCTATRRKENGRVCSVEGGASNQHWNEQDISFLAAMIALYDVQCV